MKVSKALQETASGFKGDESVNPTTVRTALEKQFDINAIDFPELKTVEITRDGKQWVMKSNYEDKVSLFSNISLLVQFDKRAVIE
jgi:Domain of unknown function (DUF4845)